MSVNKVLAMVVVLVMAGLIIPAVASSSAKMTRHKMVTCQNQELNPPISMKHELKGGEKHTFSLTLKAKDLLRLVVDQQGIDVVVRLVGLDGKPVQETDNPNGTQGAEPLSFIAAQGGTYRVEIESLKKTDQAGKYELKIEAIQTATDQDFAQVEIEKLDKQSEYLHRAGKYDQALLLAQQALKQSETVFGPEHPLVADNLVYLARPYEAKGDYATAEVLLQRSLAIREKVLDPTDPNIALSLDELARLFYYKGDYAQAETSYLKSLAMREKALGADHLEVATSLNNLAVLYRSTGEYTRAEPLLIRSQEIREKILGPTHPEVAAGLQGLGVLYFDKGDYTQAEPLLIKSLEIWEKAWGADHPLVATGLNNLAAFYYAKGDYTQAELLYTKAVETWERALGPNHPDMASSLNNLAELYCAKGDYARAEPLYARSLAIFEKALGADHPLVAMSLNNLGGLYRIKGDFAKAESLFIKSLAIREKALEPNHPDIAQSLHNLALLYTGSGDFARAEPLYLRALAIIEKALGADHPNVAISLSKLALLYCEEGDFARAEPLYLRALAINEKALGADHPQVATSLNDLAVLYQSKGDSAKAIQYRTLSNNTTERDLIHNLGSGSELQKALYLKQTELRTDLSISLHMQAAPQDPEAAKAALTVILRRKGRALDAMTSAIEVLRRQQTPEHQKQLELYARLNSQISVLTLRGPGKQKAEDYLRYVGELKNQKEQVEHEISRLSAEFKTQVTPIHLENIQKMIPPDAQLVEYAVYRPFDSKTRRFGTPRLAVYLLNNTGEIHFADLGETHPIEAAVDDFRRLVRETSSQGRSIRLGSLPKTSPVDLKTAGQTLEKLIFEPVRKLLGSTTRVLLSPDGILNLIPFDALVDDQGTYLVETFEFSYLTSGRDVLRLKTGIKSEQPPLVIANPDYARGSGPQLLGYLFPPLSPLPGTEAEAKFLRAIFPGGTVFLNAQATESVLTQARRPELLHIGTHGYFFPDVKPEFETNPEASRLIRLMDRPIPVEKVRQENPLLRSYLFFAGANHSEKNTKNDGILTALEASSLNLWGTKLVVLSACDTGLGDVRNGDGVYGLRRALVLAGSESQMVSLWPVSDTATRELMTRYYQLLKAGEGRSAALRQIRLEFLKNPKRQQPFYWASFILSGEWNPL